MNAPKVQMPRYTHCLLLDLVVLWSSGLDLELEQG